MSALLTRSWNEKAAAFNHGTRTAAGSISWKAMNSTLPAAPLPTTFAALNVTAGPAVNALLQFYGLPIGGQLVTRRNRLADFLVAM
jgi:hypothetical protein